MKLSQRQKLILAVVIFAIAGFILFKTFQSPDKIDYAKLESSTKTTSDSVGMNENTAPVGDNTIIDISDQTNNQDIISLANKFEEMSNNVDLFTSPLFIGLQDLSTNLYSEEVGRANPFSLIGNDPISKNVSQSSTTVKQKTTIGF